MARPIDDVCCASLPAGALGLLASLRTREDVRVHLARGRAWVHWDAGDDEVLHRVLAIEGAEVFARRGALWYRPGQHLPVFDVPSDEEARPLMHLLFPSPVRGEQPAAESFSPVRLRLVREVAIGAPRPATALSCPLADFAHWADGATTRQITSLVGARTGDVVLVRGEKLPIVVGGERYWGRRVLVPLGHRPEPNLSEDVLIEVLGLADGELALLRPNGAEVLPAGVLQPLTRAGIRLAVREGT
jgi:hypothetical protein